MSHIDTVIFDLGGVLLDWNPRYLYRQVFVDEHEMEYFLTFICSNTWNLMQDAGRSMAEGVTELSLRYPDYAEQITLYHSRWLETLGAIKQDTLDILYQLQQRDFALYAITNFNQETFALCRQRYSFLDIFQDIVVSGEERLIKPDPAIYLRLLHKHQLNPAECVFIDDSKANILGAEQVGMQGIHFHSAEQLQQELQQLRLV